MKYEKERTEHYIYISFFEKSTNTDNRSKNVLGAWNYSGCITINDTIDRMSIPVQVQLFSLILIVLPVGLSSLAQQPRIPYIELIRSDYYHKISKFLTINKH